MYLVASIQRVRRTSKYLGSLRLVPSGGGLPRRLRLLLGPICLGLGLGTLNGLKYVT